MKTVTDSLRDELKARREGLREVARATGVNPSVLSRFLNGSGLRSDSLDVLARYCGLALTKRRKAQKGR